MISSFIHTIPLHLPIVAVRVPCAHNIYFVFCLQYNLFPLQVVGLAPGRMFSTCSRWWGGLCGEVVRHIEFHVPNDVAVSCPSKVVVGGQMRLQVSHVLHLPWQCRGLRWIWPSGSRPQGRHRYTRRGFGLGTISGAPNATRASGSPRSCIRSRWRRPIYCRGNVHGLSPQGCAGPCRWASTVPRGCEHRCCTSS